LLGILLAFRKLALSSELDALRGIGAGYGRLLHVPYAFAIPLMVLNFGIIGYLQPLSDYRYEGLRFDLRSGALGASIKVGEFNRLGRITLRIDRSENKGTQLHGIFVQMDDKSGASVAATAEHGRFLSTDDPDTILFRLEQGRLVQNSPEFATPRTLSFASYDLPVNLPAVDSFRGRGDKLDELTIGELFRQAYGGGASSEDRRKAQANFHFRVVEVLSMLLLPLLAVALAVPPKRSSSALGIFVGIIVIVAYHKINQYGEQMGSNGRLDPVLALWIPFLLFASGIGWMYHIIAHKPGGQPIGALERFFGGIGKLLRRLVPTVRRA
jgi:lipopolysaccharide export system permease protein